MRRYQERRYWRRVFGSRPVIYIISAIIAILILKTAGTIYAALKVWEESNRIDAEISQKELKIAELEADIRKLEDGSGREEALRSHFNVIRRGEKAIIIGDSLSEEGEIGVSMNSSFISRLFQALDGFFWGE